MQRSNNTRGRNQRRSNRPRQNNQSILVRSQVLADRVINPRPWPYNASVTFIQRFRFIVQLDEAEAPLVRYPIFVPDMINLMGIVTSSTTTLTTQAPLFTRIKVLKIGLTQITGTVELQWYPDSNTTAVTNTENTQTDTSYSVDRYASVKLKPTRNSSASQWQSITTVGASFTVSCSNNAIIDLTLMCYLNNGDPFSLFGVQNGGTLATPIPVGTLLLNPLDPSGSAAAKLVPVGYANNQNPLTPTPRV